MGQCSKKILRESKMQSTNRQIINTIAKQVGHMSAGWLAINSLCSDRTPEGYFSSGFLEGSGYA
jgi:uncharacterized phage-associated protein